MKCSIHGEELVSNPLVRGGLPLCPVLGCTAPVCGSCGKPKDDSLDECECDTDMPLKAVEMIDQSKGLREAKGIVIDAHSGVVHIYSEPITEEQASHFHDDCQWMNAPNTHKDTKHLRFHFEDGEDTR